MTLNIPNNEYFIDTKKGDTVMYGNKPYRVYDDGKGNHLHIVVFENGMRKKISIETLRKQSWQYGSYQDWIFGGWSMVYDWEEYESFTSSELV
jgi:hypothetical protein